MKSLLFIVLCLATCVHAVELRGKVVGVSDGDTVTVLDAERHQHKVRLAGIDAPEKAQAFGQASKTSLSDQIFGREVLVTWDKRDRYGRIIGKISVDYRDVCLGQVRRGMAWHYKQYARDQSPDDRGAYAEAEFAARAARVGLWQDVSPVAPWEWRHKK
jgi:endonuclease YncB( thermonuclease family)